MKRTLLIAAAILSTATAAMAQDAAKPQAPRQEKASQDGPPMRTRTTVQPKHTQAAPAPASTTAEMPTAAPQPVAQPAPAQAGATNDGPPMRTRRSITSAPVATPGR